jgi:hypothetical protein
MHRLRDIASPASACSGVVAINRNFRKRQSVTDHGSVHSHDARGRCPGRQNLVDANREQRSSRHSRINRGRAVDHPDCNIPGTTDPQGARRRIKTVESLLVTANPPTAGLPMFSSPRHLSDIQCSLDRDRHAVIIKDVGNIRAHVAGFRSRGDPPALLDHAGDILLLQVRVASLGAIAPRNHAD